MAGPGDRKLETPAGYDARNNPRIASFAAQLDDQLALLKKNTAGLEVRHLEWQLHPGMNTIGMLLAHLAIVDVWWLQAAPRLIVEAEAESLLRGVIGIGMDDDGLPAKADSLHPEPLQGKTLDDYFRMLDAARAASHAQLRQWRDADLEGDYTLRDRVISKEWTLYHALEHFSGHYGQILLLKHMLRNAGLLPAS